MRKIFKLLTAATTALLLATSTQAEAAVTRYFFSGTITDVRDFIETGVASYIPYESKYYGYFDYDPDATFFSEILPERSLFQSPLTPISTTVNGYTLNSGVNQTQLIAGQNGILFLSSNQSDFSNIPTSMNGYSVVTRIQLYGPIVDRILPRTLTLDNFPGFIGLTGYSHLAESPSNFAWHISGNLTSLITAVPEPASWALMIGGFGLAGAALRSRERGMVAAG